MIRKELAVVLRDRAAMLTLFLSPVLFITVMSLALGQAFAGLGGTTTVSLMIVDEDGNLAGPLLAKAMSGTNDLKVETTVSGRQATRDDADRAVRSGQVPMAIIVLGGFGAAVSDGAPGRIDFIVDPSASGEVVLPLQAALRTAVGRISDRLRAAQNLQRELAITDDPNTQRALETQLAKLNEASDVAAKVTFPPGVSATAYPSVYQQNVPGYTVMYVFFIVTTMAGSILTERREGTFRRLLSAPVTKWRILAGKIFPYWLIAVLQVVLLTAFGRIAFGMDLGRHPIALLPVTLGLGTCACGLGVLLAAFARTDSQVSGLGTIVILVLAALGGCMVPTVFMPGFMTKISLFTPHGLALTAFQDVYVRGANVLSVLPAAGILFGAGVLFVGAALPRFRFA